jgi:hypothetical protein
MQSSNDNTGDQIQTDETTPSEPSVFDASIGSTFKRHRIAITFTYTLFVVENLLRLAQPFALGWAINDLLEEQSTGLFVLIGQHVLHLLIGLWRQVLDTRVFTKIYSEMVTDMIVTQRAAGVEVSRVAARSSLSREFVNFFELTVPNIARSAFSIVGSLIMLAIYDWVVVVACIGLLLPASFLNRWFAMKIRFLNRKLHDELEREVDLIEPGQQADLQTHFGRIANWRVRLSNAEAINFGMMEIFVLGVIVVTLLRTTSLVVNAGDVFAVFRYLMLLLIGLDRVPQLIMQISRMRDIQSRMEST